MRRNSLREAIKQISLEGGTELMPLIEMADLVKDKLREMSPQNKKILLCNKSIGKTLNEFMNVERRVVRNISYHRIHDVRK